MYKVGVMGASSEGECSNCGGDLDICAGVVYCVRCGDEKALRLLPPLPACSAVTTCYARPEEIVPEAPAEQGVMPACVSDRNGDMELCKHRNTKPIAAFKLKCLDCGITIND